MKRTFTKSDFWLVLICLLMEAAATASHAQARRPALKDIPISCEIVNRPVADLLHMIQSKTGFTFSYDNKEINLKQPISVNLKNINALAVLNEVSRKTNLDFQRMNNTIIVSLNEEREKQQQQKRSEILITGTVSDLKGPLPGVSVFEKGTGKGTTTDEKGTFSLKVTENAQITLKMVGYKAHDFTAVKGKVYNLMLQEDNQSLGEVVVIGYGERVREKVTGAISSISAKEIENLPATSFQNMLQGRVPGLNVLNFTGEPGAGSLSLIRGLSGASRSGAPVNISPLYVIDGMPFSPDDFGAIPSLKGRVVKTTNTDPLSMINPNDIESIDILKDASATAIYGSRGANGVIIVKTKQGRLGKPSITFNTNVGVSSPPPFRSALGGKLERETRLKYMNKYAREEADFVQINNLAFITDSLNSFYNNASDWQKMYYKPSMIQNYTLGISGAAADQITYRANLGYSDEGGIMKNTGYERYTLNTSFVFRPSSKIDVNLDLAGTMSDKKRGNGADQNAMGIGSTFNTSLYPLPTSGELDNYFKAYTLLDEKLINRNFRGSLGLNYRLFKDLRLTSNIRLNYGMDSRSTFRPSDLNSNKKPSYNSYEGTNSSLLNENIITYFKTIKKHSVVLDLGFTQDYLVRENLTANATDGISNYLKVLNGFPKDKVTMIEDYTKSARLSYFARLNYDFESKYLFSASMRRDGSSRFGETNKWGNFPAVAVAWNIHKEGFMKSIDWVNSAKLRLSSGTTGSEFYFDYLTQGLYDAGAAGDIYNGGTPTTYNGITTSNPWYDKGLTNETLTWEKSVDKNVGLDLTFVDGKFGFNFDFYWKESKGKLFDVFLPNTSGYKMIYTNGQSVLNYGYEFAVYADLLPENTKLRWSINANAAINRNVLLGIGTDNRDVYDRFTERLLRVGRPLNDFYVHETMGVYARDEDVPVNPKTGFRLAGSDSRYPFKAGDIIVRDVDGDYRVGYEVNNTRGELISGDKIYGGNPNPTVNGGLRNDFRYKQFSLSVFFVYSIGRKIINRTLADRLTPTALLLPNSIPDLSNIQFWEKEGDIAQYPAYNPFNKNNTLNYSYQQTLFVENGSFARLKNIQLSYELSQKLLKKTRFRRVNLFAQMDNVFIIQKFKGPDAENVDFSGIDRGGFYPIPKKMTFGFNIQI